LTYIAQTAIVVIDSLVFFFTFQPSDYGAVEAEIIEFKPCLRRDFCLGKFGRFVAAVKNLIKQ
jgi:hypothetical protein